MQFAGFVFRPSLGPSIVFLALLALLLGLGVWQLDRAAQKEAMMVSKASKASDQLLALNERAAKESDRFAPAQVRGRYFERRQWLLDNRLVAGQAGYHVYSLFEFNADGQDQAVLVNRGWVAVGESRAFLPSLPLPEGELSIHGNLDLPASVGLKLDSGELDGLAPLMVVQHLDIADLAQALGREIAPYALMLDRGQPGALKYDWTYVETMSPDKHRGYAVQWFGLALALVIIYIGTNTKGGKRNSNDEHAVS